MLIEFGVEANRSNAELAPQFYTNQYMMRMFRRHIARDDETYLVISLAVGAGYLIQFWYPVHVKHWLFKLNHHRRRSARKRES